MQRDLVRKIALENGFKLKDQPDGITDLNPYVYDFANALEDSIIERIVQSIIKVVDEPFNKRGEDEDSSRM